MEVRKLNRSLIELAVEQGIREMRQDVRRGLRRLVDLGLHFASGRFSENVFIRINQELEQEDSRYYHLIQNFLKNIDHKTITTFCVNLGYNSWICGAEQIRRRELLLKEKQEKASGELQESGEKQEPGKPRKKRWGYSWISSLTFDAGNADPSDELKRLSQIISRKRQEGVYTYVLQTTRSFSDSPELVFLLDRFQDCAFLWFFHENDLTDAQVAILKKRNNCLYLFPAMKKDGTANLEIARKMKKNKILYSFYYIYEETAGGLKDYVDAIAPCMEEEPVTLILKAAESVSPDYRESFSREVWKNRVTLEYGVFLVELDEDCREVERIIGESGKQVPGKQAH